MNKYHKEIKQALLKASKNKSNCTSGYWDTNYTGSLHKSLFLRNDVKRKIVKEWAKKHKNLTYQELIDLIDSLLNESTFQEERKIISDLLLSFKKHKQQLELSKLKEWISKLVGWEEIDSLCQTTFDDTDLNNKKDNWYKFLLDLSLDNNISCRRASLVLLIKTLRKTDDKLWRNLAFKNIKTLAKEDHKLITKAISWILREMVKLHKKEVEQFIEENNQVLTKSVIREVKRKILTGKK